jgi:hypothetical protein
MPLHRIFFKAQKRHALQLQGMPSDINPPVGLESDLPGWAQNAVDWLGARVFWLPL